MWGWFKRKKENVLTYEQLKALSKETGRFIEVWWDDGRYIRIWEPGRIPEDPDKGKYY